MYYICIVALAGDISNILRVSFIDDTFYWQFIHYFLTDFFVLLIFLMVLYFSINMIHEIYFY